MVIKYYIYIYIFLPHQKSLNTVIQGYSFRVLLALIMNLAPSLRYFLSVAQLIPSSLDGVLCSRTSAENIQEISPEDSGSDSILFNSLSGCVHWLYFLINFLFFTRNYLQMHYHCVHYLLYYCCVAIHHNSPNRHILLWSLSLQHLCKAFAAFEGKDHNSVSHWNNHPYLHQCTHWRMIARGVGSQRAGLLDWGDRLLPLK